MSLRIGVLGASRIAEAAIIGPAHDLGHRLVAVAARDPRRAQAFAEKYGVERALASYEDVINDPEVDVVYNPLANSLHAPWNLAAVAAGKPVLTEKPFARNRTEAMRVAEAADSAGVPVVEGFHYLFHPVTRRALELAGDGTLGDITHVEVRMAMPEPSDSDPRWSLELGGGALMDLGCYGLHVMRQLGHPSVVRAHAKEHSPGVDAWCDVELAFPSGATGLSANSMVADDRTHSRFRSSAPREMSWCTTSSSPATTIESPFARPRAPPSNIWAPGRRIPTNWRRSPNTSCTARRCR